MVQMKKKPFLAITPSQMIQFTPSKDQSAVVPAAPRTADFLVRCFVHVPPNTIYKKHKKYNPARKRETAMLATALQQ